MRVASIIVGATLTALITVVSISARQGNFIIYGTVSLPNGNPAVHVHVRITGQTGLNFETPTDNSGRYQFQVPGGRYRLVVTNPQVPEQYTDPAEADTTRGAGNRLLVNLYLRDAPAKQKADSSSRVVSVAEASQLVPKDARKAYEDGVKQKTRNQIDKALQSLNRAIELFPEYFQAFAERGELRISQSLIAEALEDFERSLRLNPDYGAALRGAGYCKLEQQKFDESMDYLERAILIEPGIASSHLFLGIANLALDRRDRAKQSLLEALKIDSDRAVTAHIYLADLYARQSRHKDAADELRIYLTARPDAPNAQRLRAKEAELRARAKK